MSALCRPAGHTVLHGAAMSRYLLVCRTPRNILTTTCRVRSASASTPTALRAVKGVIRTPPSPSPALAARHPGQRKRQAPARREPAARLFLSLSAVARAAPLGELQGSGLRVGRPPGSEKPCPQEKLGFCSSARFSPTVTPSTVTPGRARAGPRGTPRSSHAPTIVAALQRSLDIGPCEPNEKATKSRATRRAHVRPAAAATDRQRVSLKGSAKKVMRNCRFLPPGSHSG